MTTKKTTKGAVPVIKTTKKNADSIDPIVLARVGLQPIAGAPLAPKHQRALAHSFQVDGVNAAVLTKCREAITRTERVAAVADLMSRGMWYTPVVKILCEEWGMRQSAVIDISSEASRWVRGALGSQDEIRTRLFTTAERITTMALEQGDLKVALASLRTIGEISGTLSTRIQHEITGANGGALAVQLSTVKALSDDELDRELLKAQVAKIERNIRDDRREPTSTEAALIAQLASQEAVRAMLPLVATDAEFEEETED